MQDIIGRLLLGFGLLVSVGVAAVQAQSIEVGFGGILQNPDGHISYKGDRLDVERDMGLDKKLRPHARIKAYNPLPYLPNVYLMGNIMKFDGNGTRNVSFSYGGVTFSPDVSYTTKVKMNFADIALFYSLPMLEDASNGMLSAEIGLNVRVMDFKASVSQPETGLFVSKSYVVPVPMVYLAAQARPAEQITLDLEGRGIAYKNNHFLDLIGRVKFRPVVDHPMHIGIGYRFQNVRVDHKGVDADITIHGPFAEIGFTF